ncbi:MAG TPA: hypothetical protein VKE69_12795 [Planctomycetota bacterium]|nr:hypothetical protein [Planctomycetota bacterium]
MRLALFAFAFGLGGSVAPSAPAPFELLVTSGHILVIDTVSATLTAKDGQVATFTNGDIHVDTLEVEAGAAIFGVGPNPLRFFVKRRVAVDGAIHVDGGDAPDVEGLASLGFPVVGGAGACGGGDGGVGNPIPIQSSAVGGTGDGPFGASDGGGFGGESSLIPDVSCAGAFPPGVAGGGGGGSFATSGDPGATGGPPAGCSFPGKSAVDPSHPPFGGEPGLVAFATALVTDDFFGASRFRDGVALGGSFSLVTAAPGSFTPRDANRWIGLHRLVGTWEDSTPGCANAPGDLVQCPRSTYLLRRIASVVSDSSATIVPALPAAPAPGDVFVIYGTGDIEHGELLGALGGQGGGGGGNAIAAGAFPNPAFPNGDWRGAGGGGGGGVLEIHCAGCVAIAGVLSADGGAGALGQAAPSTPSAPICGSGGGSGGMIRVESGHEIDLEGGALFARGGEGGRFVDPNPIFPPPPPSLGIGGRGGKGLIQLHAPADANGNPKILFGPGQPVSAQFDPAPVLCLPRFGG